MPTVLLLVGAALCAALHIWAYFTAEAPHSGSLEWISLYEKPKMTRQILCRLRWLDLLWSFLLFLLATILYAAPMVLTDVTLLQSGWLLLASLPTALSAAGAYLLGKSLSGKFFVGLLPMLLVTFSAFGSYFNAETCLMLLCLLLTLVYLSGRGFWAWLSLIFSGILLGITTWLTPLFVFFALPWLGTVLFAEILRMKQEDTSPWHLILALLAASTALDLTITVLHFPLAAPDLVQALQTPAYYTLFWKQLAMLLPRKLFRAGDLSVTLPLPSAALLVAGVVMGVGATAKKHTLGVVLLLWSVTGLALWILFPSVFPYFLPALTLAYLATRLHIRECGAAAWIVGLIAPIITLITAILTIWRYVL